MRSLRRLVLWISLTAALMTVGAFFAFALYRASWNNAATACTFPPDRVHGVTESGVRPTGWLHTRFICVGWNDAGDEVTTWRAKLP